MQQRRKKTLTSYIGDIESDGFLDEMTKVHCIVLHDLESEKYLRFNDQPHPFVKHGSIDDACLLMSKAERLFFHFGHGFDYLALKRFCKNFNPKVSALFDTVTMATAVYRDIKGIDFGAMKKGKRHPEFAKMGLVGKHSLKAWGYRLGVLKSSIADSEGVTDWSSWTPEMEDYCEQDVRVTVALYKLLTSERNLEFHPWECHSLDNMFQHCISRQEKHGFYFHEDKAEALNSELQTKLVLLEKELQDEFKPFYKRDKQFTPKRDNIRAGYVAGAEFTKVKLVEFSPSSRDHIQNRLQKLYGWKPAVFGADGKATVDEQVLSSLPYPTVPRLIDYLVLNKTIGMLSAGKQAWLKYATKGRIHGRVDTMGAVTWRCTHSKPNVAQVPSVRIDSEHIPLYGQAGRYGADCRGLFAVPHGRTLCGYDGSGLELRCLAHYMAIYDGGAYATIVVHGDVHTENQRAVGLNQRNSAKTWIYAFLYGAGDFKLGTIVVDDMSPEQRHEFFENCRAEKLSVDEQITRLGRESRARIVENLPALGKLIKDVKKQAKLKGYLKGLDGRRLPVRSQHAALNTLLQSAGAIIMKRWLVILDSDLQEKGMVPYQWRYRGKDAPVEGNYEYVANVHDEAQTEVDDLFTELYGDTALAAFPKAGNYYNFRSEITGAGKHGRCWTDTH